MPSPASFRAGGHGERAPGLHAAQLRARRAEFSGPGRVTATPYRPDRAGYFTLTLTVTVAVATPPRPSLIVYEKLSLPLRPPLV